jgi:uncharacterized protein (TIGR00255 family)
MDILEWFEWLQAFFFIRDNPALFSRSPFMVLSMTAFASREFQIAEERLRWDIKSVNHRYLEMSFKLPDIFQELESNLRELIRSQVHRGKVYCTLSYEIASQGQRALDIDWPLSDEIYNASQEIRNRYAISTPISPFDILKWPNVVKVPLPNKNVLNDEIAHTFLVLVQELVQTRGTEGKELKGFIEQRLNKMDELMNKVKEWLPQTLSSYRERLLNRIHNVKIEFDSGRLEQEMVLVAQKIDVTEELDRLTAHLKATRLLLHQGGTVGRQLDFLMQELNREVNTLASKSIDAAVTQAAVEMKVLIEQMREQIQNIE